MRTCGGGQNTGLSLYASGVAAVWIQELRLRSLSWLDEPGSAVHMIGCWSGSPTRWNPSQSMVRRRARVMDDLGVRLLAEHVAGRPPAAELRGPHRQLSDRGSEAGPLGLSPTCMRRRATLLGAIASQ